MEAQKLFGSGLRISRAAKTQNIAHFWIFIMLEVYFILFKISVCSCLFTYVYSIHGFSQHVHVRCILCSCCTADCWDRVDGEEGFQHVLSSPGEANGEDMFHFGTYQGNDDDEGREWCEDKCKDREDCYIYTFYSIFDDDTTWKSQCMGKTDQDTILNADLYGYSGTRAACSGGKIYITKHIPEKEMIFKLLRLV